MDMMPAGRTAASGSVPLALRARSAFFLLTLFVTAVIGSVFVLLPSALLCAGLLPFHPGLARHAWRAIANGLEWVSARRAARAA